MMSSGSSRLTARPMVSALRAMPGPLVVVTPRWPPKAAPSAAPMPAISSSACSVRTPKFLCLDSSWRMSDAGVIGYEPRNSGRLRQLAGGDQAPGQRGVAGDVRVDAGLRAAAGLHLVGVVEQLGGLAEGVAGLEGGQVGVAAPAACCANRLVDPLERGLDRAGCTSTR